MPMRTFRLGLVVVLALAISLLAQETKEPSPQGQTPTTVDGIGAVYHVGNGVSAPRATKTPDPEYTKEARKAKYEGTTVLWVIVDTDGNPRNIKVQRSSRPDLDQKAIEAVKKWRFTPAMKDGQPVAVQVNIEVNFRLY